jgi:hypothetical protein
MWRLIRNMAVLAGVLLVTANCPPPGGPFNNPQLFRLMTCVDNLGVEPVTVEVDPLRGDTVILATHRHQLVIPAGAVTKRMRLTFEVPIEAINERIAGVHIKTDSSITRFEKPLELSLSYAHCSPAPGKIHAIAVVRNGSIDRTYIGGVDSDPPVRGLTPSPRDDEDGDAIQGPQSVRGFQVTGPGFTKPGELLSGFAVVSN